MAASEPLGSLGLSDATPGLAAGLFDLASRFHIHLRVRYVEVFDSDPRLAVLLDGDLDELVDLGLAFVGASCGGPADIDLRFRKVVPERLGVETPVGKLEDGADDLLRGNDVRPTVGRGAGRTLLHAAAPNPKVSPPPCPYERTSHLGYTAS